MTRRLHRLYTRAVLWLLSVVAQDAADTLRADGADVMRDVMAAELRALQASTAIACARHYERGVRDAMVFFSDDDLDERATQKELVH